MRRRWLSGAAVLMVEGYLYYRYAQLDAQFHFWLHGLLGAALALAALTTARLTSQRQRPRREGPRRPRGHVASWAAGWGGHMYSAVPDVLFLGAGVPHVAWMDVFAFHITVHLIPAPLAAMLTVFLLALAAYALAMSGRTVPAAAVLGTAAVTLATVLALAAPIPAHVQDLRGVPGIAWFPVPPHHH